MIWTVYILRSIKDRGYYVGCTSNLFRRLDEHNCGYNYSTKNRTPLELIHKEEYTNQQVAFAREKIIKSYKGGRGLKLLLENKRVGGGVVNRT